MSVCPKLLLSALVVSLAACGDTSETVEYQTYVVRKTPLRISIQQKGSIESRNPFRVVNPVEGRTILLDIVPEGTMVKEGDWLFELDVSEARDRLLQQEIATSTAQQSLFNAEQQLEIQTQQNESDVKRAELNVRFAELDMKQYIQGDLPSELETVEANITLAREELERAKDTYTWSGKLAEKGYISNDKLESDRLAVKRREIDLDLAGRKQDVLKEYTSKKRTEELEANLEEARRELKRVRAKVAAARAQAEGDVERRRDQHEVEVTKLNRLKRMVENNVVTAEKGGLVVYGRESRGRDSKPIEPGTQVREGQTILEIPDMSNVLVDVDVHESWVHLVKLDQPVIVTTDTGEAMIGRVQQIAAVPDSQSWYRNPDLKVYSTSVALENKNGTLRPGMNCAAEIVIDDVKDAIAVPVQAVHSNGAESFCYVQNDEGEAELRKVDAGRNNATLVEIIGDPPALREGDVVFLSVPPQAPTIPLSKGQNKRVEVEAGSMPAKKAGGDAAAPDGAKGDGERSRRRPEGAPKFDRAALLKETEGMTDAEKMEYMKKKFGGRGMGGGRKRGAGEGGGRRGRSGGGN